MSKWISVEDRTVLIPVHERVLTHDKDGYTLIAAYDYGDDAFYPIHGEEQSKTMGAFLGVTHWMPLPDPPEYRLDPCPFCSNRHIEIRHYRNEHNALWFTTECMRCEARGPSAKTKGQAAAGWNEPRGAL